MIMRKSINDQHSTKSNTWLSGHQIILVAEWRTSMIIFSLAHTSETYSILGHKGQTFETELNIEEIISQ